jgi:hypothetical protein
VRPARLQVTPALQQLSVGQQLVAAVCQGITTRIVYSWTLHGALPVAGSVALAGAGLMQTGVVEWRRRRGFVRAHG